MERVGDGHAFGGCADVSKNSTQARAPSPHPREEAVWAPWTCIKCKADRHSGCERLLCL